MLVKFKNTEVPIWKLRKGVVVAYECTGLNYAHLHTFCLIYSKENFWEITIDEFGNLSQFDSADLIWLET